MHLGLHCRRAAERLQPAGLLSLTAAVPALLAVAADDDLLVSQEVVSLKDPMSGQRMQVRPLTGCCVVWCGLLQARLPWTPHCCMMPSIASSLCPAYHSSHACVFQVPARFVDASGLQPFDLDSFLSMAQRNRKWQDPTTLNNSSVEQLQVGAGGCRGGTVRGVVVP